MTGMREGEKKSEEKKERKEGIHKRN